MAGAEASRLLAFASRLDIAEMLSAAFAYKPTVNGAKQIMRTTNLQTSIQPSDLENRFRCFGLNSTPHPRPLLIRPAYV